MNTKEHYEARQATLLARLRKRGAVNLGPTITPSEFIILDELLSGPRTAAELHKATLSTGVKFSEYNGQHYPAVRGMVKRCRKRYALDIPSRRHTGLYMLRNPDVALKVLQEGLIW